MALEIRGKGGDWTSLTREYIKLIGGMNTLVCGWVSEVVGTRGIEYLYETVSVYSMLCLLLKKKKILYKMTLKTDAEGGRGGTGRAVH